MNVDEAVAKITRRRVFLALGPIVPTFLAVRLVAHGQDKSGFPDGYNAVQAAPKSHRVIFENLLVRVLEVILLHWCIGTNASPSLAEFLF